MPRPDGASMTCRGALLLITMTLCLAALPARAQEPSQSAAHENEKWGYTWKIGGGGAGGDFGNLLREPVSSELDIFLRRGSWRFGAGFSYGSFGMKSPYEDEKEWGFLQSSLFATRMFNDDGAISPYLQLRGGLARLHPRSLLFAPTPLPEDLEPGDSPTTPSNGFSVSLVPGVEWRLSSSVSLDTSFSFTYFKVGEYDLSPVNQPPQSSGTEWQALVGASWVPLRGTPVGDRVTDAWGVQRSYGWATGEMLGINYVAGVVNEYVRDANFNQTSPRSWWANLEEGFTYDDNQFKTNQWAHPFNGASYFNAGRSNGLSFWPSSAYATVGAFYWECCGETHPMSINDLIATSLGGISTGEARYRLSSEILDNSDTGMSRWAREIAALFVNPIRGFNRLVSGHAQRVMPNPESSADRHPVGSRVLLGVGSESVGEGSSISSNTQTYPMILFNQGYGNIFDTERRKPFDTMEFVGEIDLGDKTALDNVQVRGDVASWPLSSNHVVHLVQYFDYMNNDSYEFGGQSFSLSLSSRFRLSEKVHLTTRVDGIGLVLGGVNSDYSWLADVADQERIREYDYGPGLGAMARATLSLSGHPLLQAFYRYQHMDVSNGSVFHGDQLGADADHDLHAAGLRLVVPIIRNLGIGVDGLYFDRDSHYIFTHPETGEVREQDVDQRNPQLRIYLAFSSGY
jgi:hypothetical protein